MSPSSKHSGEANGVRAHAGQAGTGLGRKITRKQFLKTAVGAGIALPVLSMEGVDPRTKGLGKFEPPDGKIYTGVCASEKGDSISSLVGRWEAWTDTMGGKPAAISHTFNGLPPWFSFDFDTADARNASAALISWQTGDTSPWTIAQNTAVIGGVSSDKHILEAAKNVALWKKPVFLRINQEMNAHWMPWCAFNSDDSSRSHTPRDFRQMWRRMHILYQGGTVQEVNARLAAVGLPPVDYSFAESTTFPTASNVAFVFNPDNSPGAPEVDGNRWADYYPGDAYVDWVGQTFYNATHGTPMDQRFAWLDEFYGNFCTQGTHNKPYMMGEWGLASAAWSGFGDNPQFIHRTLDWAESKPKVESVVYFEVDNDRGHRLTKYPEPGLHYPNAAAALRDRWLSSSYLSTVSEAT